MVGKKQCRTLTFWPLPTLPSDTVRSHFAQFGELVDVVSVWRRTGGGWGAGGASLRRVACALGKKKARFPRHPTHTRSHTRTCRPPSHTTQTIMRDRLTRQPRGFGFVTFASPAAADAATSAPHWLDGNRIDAKRSVPHDARPRSKKVFVGGLAPETSAGKRWCGGGKRKEGKKHTRALAHSFLSQYTLRRVQRLFRQVWQRHRRADHGGPLDRAVARLWVSGEG